VGPSPERRSMPDQEVMLLVRHFLTNVVDDLLADAVRVLGQACRHALEQLLPTPEAGGFALLNAAPNLTEPLLPASACIRANARTSRPRMQLIDKYAV
jgi:hypothetical protein